MWKVPELWKDISEREIVNIAGHLWKKQNKTVFAKFKWITHKTATVGGWSYPQEGATLFYINFMTRNSTYSNFYSGNWILVSGFGVVQTQKARLDISRKGQMGSSIHLKLRSLQLPKQIF